MILSARTSVHSCTGRGSREQAGWVGYKAAICESATQRPATCDLRPCDPATLRPSLRPHACAARGTVRPVSSQSSMVWPVATAVGAPRSPSSVAASSRMLRVRPVPAFRAAQRLAALLG
ncbi:hypothetical protein BS50DRAFT_341842 [Corynespora cassiicola Philippines]|uniref:Uncharacterized protein n=1 Tax=Corynespora cassiicola Philippines TaxID=1448308 RepID=A0A2T2NVH7_CORCC|nr:hypothetical protein BS50DRAFT_341842 [Corynespora cassiicola Philippines]